MMKSSRLRNVSAKTCRNAAGAVDSVAAPASAVLASAAARVTDKAPAVRVVEMAPPVMDKAPAARAVATARAAVMAPVVETVATIRLRNPRQLNNHEF